MSLSLSSLLNPSPEADSQPEQQQSSSPTLTRKDSLPPIQYAHSPTQQDAVSPQGAHQPPQRSSHPPATESDAAQALAALSSNHAPPSMQSPWSSHTHGGTDGHESQRWSSSIDQRPGSSGMQLPPPPPSTIMDRKMSSPTLEQYQVASRSPEQRRASLISPPQSAVTLPPIHSVGHAHSEHTERRPGGHGHVEIDPHVHSANSFAGPHVDTSSGQPPLPPNPYASGTTEMTPPSSSAPIKQEALGTPRASSPTEAHQIPIKQGEVEMDIAKAVTSLKNEHGLRTNLPLRESSVPVQSTEVATPEPTIPKKRPAPAKTKKGTATMKKTAPPTKKRKIEPKRSLTPSSRASKPTFKTASSKGTPANSSPAPSSRSQSAEADDEPYDDDDVDEGPAGSDDELYCICRKPDNGTFMIGCDGTCDDWFHGKCVGIEERDKNLIDKYICPSCTKAGIGRTTWKRMCRRSGCRQAARIGKTKNGKEGSKYCSEECGVLFFREIVGRTRGKEEMGKHRSSRRKNSFVDIERVPLEDEDLGARGGVLSAGELKSLINSSKTAEDFKKLGEGVLSPPSTPDSKSPTTAKKHIGADFTESETTALEGIEGRKDEARRKHQLLKDRMKFIQMAKQAASRTATEKELKPKDYCGYDSRIEWTEQQFGLWRSSNSGKRAFELGTLSTETSRGNEEQDKDAMDVTLLPPAQGVLVDGFEVCDRKKCARHLEWGKLAVDGVRFEMADNSDKMRALEVEEREIRQRAVLRAKAGSLTGEGSVEVHGLGINVDEGPAEATGGEMEVDPVA